MAEYINEVAADITSDVALTVIAQSFGIDEVDPAGRYMYPVFFPTVPAAGTKLAELTETDFRPVATHREWNAHGKEIALPTPKVKEYQMVPLEARNGMGEKEMTDLLNRYQGNAAIVDQQLMRDVPARVRWLVDAVHRGLEVQASDAWAKGTVTIQHPTGGASYTASLGFETGRVETASTAWDDAGANAYNEFVAWWRDVLTDMDAVGVVLSRLAFNAIQADAPNIMDYGGQGVLPGAAMLAERIRQDTGSDFRFVLNDTRVDKFTDGGSGKTRTRTWDESYVAAIPASGRVGSTHAAIVESAYDALQRDPNAPIDVRGVGVRKNPENKGKYLDLMATALWWAIPNEQNVRSIDTGINS